MNFTKFNNFIYLLCDNQQQKNTNTKNPKTNPNHELGACCLYIYFIKHSSPLLMCSECVSLSVNFYRKTGGVRMRGHETSSSAHREVHEFLSFSHRKWMLD